MTNVISLATGLAVEASNDTVVATTPTNTIKIKQKVLLAALAAHKGVANPKSSMPILANVLLHAADGVLTLRTNNLVEEITTVLPCDGDILITASARHLHDMVKACTTVAKGKNPDNEITLAVTDNGSVKISGTAELTVVAMSAADYPKAMCVDADGSLVTYVGDKLRSSLDFVLPAISTDATRYNLNGVLFEETHLAATDGHRLHKVTGMPECGEAFIVPRTGVYTLCKMLKGVSEVQATFGKGVAHFALGDSELCVKLIDATFPPINQVIPQRDYCEAGFTANRASFIAAVNAAAAMSSDKTWGVKLNTEGAELYVSSDNPDMGESKAPFKGVARSAAPWAIGVNAKYLLEAVNTFDSEEIEMLSSGELDPMRMDHDGRTVVIMPMRI